MRSSPSTSGSSQNCRKFDRELLTIHSDDVLALIRSGNPTWETQVPPPVAEVIKNQCLLGYRD